MVVAITGASAGIGAACARLLASRGIAVVLQARRAERLEQVKADIDAAGGRARAIPGDVTQLSDVEALVGEAISAFGRLDVMICNAGIGFHGSIDETSPATMQRLMDVNFMGTFHAVKAAMPHFRAQRSGHFIIMSSIVGQRGVGYTSAYSATKAAQIGFAEALRVELQGAGIAVSAVCPISTATEFREAMRRDFGHAASGVGPRQSADSVAHAVVRAIDHPAPEVYPYRLSRALVVLNALAPGLTDRVVRRFARKRTSLP